MIEPYKLYHCRVCKKAMGNTSIIVQNQFYFIGFIPEKFDQHFDRALAVQIFLYQLMDGAVLLLHGKLHAMCHFQLILEASCTAASSSPFTNVTYSIESFWWVEFPAGCGRIVVVVGGDDAEGP